MMRKVIFGITILAVLTHINPTYAKAREARVESSAQPITALISDWSQFRAGIIAKTSQYDKYSNIKPGQLPGLRQSMIGKWNMVNSADDSGYRIHAILDLKKHHRFTYDYRIKAGNASQDWAFSGRWQEKNKILMLLISKSSYPGEASGNILFWRLLQIGHDKLVYVSSSMDRMQAMTRGSGIRGS
jgi:hypothetical protein